MTTKDHSEVIHISKINKKIFDIYIKENFLMHHLDLNISIINNNMVFESMLKNYLGLDFFSIKSKVENEFNNKH